MSSSHHPSDYPPPSHFGRDTDLKRALASALDMLDQTPPPSLREILGAYRSKGDGDRDMLLAMLNAKAAEDQRLASFATLRRSTLEVYQAASPLQTTNLPPRLNHHYPTPSFTQSPPLHEQRPSRRIHHRTASSGSRSPHHIRSHPPSSMRDHTMHHEPPRKRHRPSHSPPSAHAVAYETISGSQPEHLPPSPYSSSGRSDSAEYSPRSRASMAIGSLLSAGPSKDINGDEP